MNAAPVVVEHSEPSTAELLWAKQSVTTPQRRCFTWS